MYKHIMNILGSLYQQRKSMMSEKSDSDPKFFFHKKWVMECDERIIFKSIYSNGK